MLRSRPPRTFVLAGLLIVLASGCAGPPERNPLPGHLADVATIPGIPHARTWADAPSPYTDRVLELPTEELQARYPAIFGRPHSYLAISGGGARGAFGAGLLVGWSQAGTRPEFSYVTGVSTGALTAPFAFLGSDYDHVLEKLYTEFSTADLVEKRGLVRIVRGDALVDTDRMEAELALVMNEEVMVAIADEYERGRGLQIVTTNLDARRPVAWNIGRIAASGEPGALQLIRDVMLASASIPAVFPPVMFDVVADGQLYDELHVDGGVTSVVYLYPLGLDWDVLTERLETKGNPDVYVIRNGFLNERWSTVDRRVLAIATQTIDALMGAVVLGDMHRIYLATRRDGLDYHLAFIPEDFDFEAQEAFDLDFMRALYSMGLELGRAGYEWATAPPGYDTGEDEFLLEQAP